MLDNPQYIQNNGNTNFQQISWKPVSNNYYYRALEQSDLVFGNISVINNGLIDIQLEIDVGNISPLYGAQDINVELQTLEIEFDEIVNINPSASLSFFEYPRMAPFKIYQGSAFTGSGTKKGIIGFRFQYIQQNGIRYDLCCCYEWQYVFKYI